MQSINNGNLLEIIDLAHSLRQEHLFIVNEQETFNALTETLNDNSAKVAQLAWICAQQRENLNALVVSRPDAGPSSCCYRSNSLESTRFVEAHKAKSLEYQHALAYTELFNLLHHSPYLLAQTLSIGDRIDGLSNKQMDSVVRTITTGLFGNIILSKDVDMILRLIHDLIEIQIVDSENPRRLIRSGTNSFSRLYNCLRESLFSAKLFLTAALHEPVMNVLIGEEIMLDIDIAKAVLNIPAKERHKRFGQEGTDEYQTKFREFGRETIDRLYKISKQFIQSMADNWALFPSTLRWVVQTMFHLLKSTQRISAQDLNYILTDMVFTNFICPAIVSPDLYGISDAPISEIARFNLMQIGQIIQMLALIRHQEVDAKYVELFEMFNRNIVADLMDQLLDTECDVRVSMLAIPHQNDFGRVNVLVTQSELNTFVDFFRAVLDHDELTISGEDRRKLGKILAQLPDRWTTIVNGVCDQNQSLTTTQTEGQSKTKQLLNLGKSTRNRLAKSISLNVTSDMDEALQPFGVATTNGIGNIGLNNNNYGDNGEYVIMIRISINEDSQFQLLTEQEVLNMNNISNQMEANMSEPSVSERDKVNDDAFDGLSEAMPTRKHTRFSMSHDDQSIGNSDNLEVVSEAPSNHSVTSSLELEENDQNLNDNLSDMISANVSGRGSPNISGRDTPSSQVTEGENGQMAAPQSEKMLSKARSDIDEKFCKFEIKKQVEGDETVSIISDTWSTDVLASDSETLEPAENERNFSTPLIPSAVVLPGDNNFNPIANSVSQLRANYLDASDTRSESAWSTDVLASDSEKMTEIDTDDNQSIAAKSDITDAGRSDGDPIPDLIPLNQRAPDSPFFTPRNPNAPFRGHESPMFAQRPQNESPSFSSIRANLADRQSPRFTSDEYNARVGGCSGSGGSGNGNGRPKRYTDNASSLFRNYRSTNNDPSERDMFLNTTSAPMRRQNSAESSISNQSSSQLDDAVALNKAKKLNSQKKSSYSFGEYSSGNSRIIRPEPNIVKTSTDIINPFADDDAEAMPFPQRSFQVENDDFDTVERRPASIEQRNVSYDGRRNGVAFSAASTSTTTKRLVSSLTYENHEIIIKNNKTHSLQFLPHNELETSATDDDKNKHQDEMLLAQKTLAMNLNETSDDNILVDLTSPSIEANRTDAKSSPKYTGTIPKSISFDSSADKSNDRSQFIGPVTHHHSAFRQNGFFNKIKQGFKNRRNHKLPRGFEDFTAQPSTSRANTTNEICGTDSALLATDNSFIDTTEDILAKYRRKISSSSEATNSDSIGADNLKAAVQTNDQRLSLISHEESLYAYTKAKQKLRLVLSTTDLHTADFRHTSCHKTPPLLTYLQIQLAQALNLQNLQQIAYVSEAIRCVNQLDPNQQSTLVADLQTDLVKRQSYLQYLMRYRQTLLSALKNIDRFEERLRNDSDMCNRHLIMVCVRMFLKKRELAIERFQTRFAEITVVDEKIDFMIQFMNELMNDLRADGILHGMTDGQFDEARACIEQVLMQRLYRQVMFPNDDADISRDEVLREHIRKLAQIISPSHNALKISEEFLVEAPWPFAQQQISYISAYKTPREKVVCVVRCIRSIMNLLQMSSNRIPSADDLIPVLIYVIIKANPPYLLSTIQYVNAFIGDQINGEDQYWWIQFCSAVTFIKTMDYSD